jgi:hypothetical protein
MTPRPSRHATMSGAPSRVAQVEVASDNARALASSTARQYHRRSGPGPVQPRDQPLTCSGLRAALARRAKVPPAVPARATTRMGSVTSIEVRGAISSSPRSSGSQANTIQRLPLRISLLSPTSVHRLTVTPQPRNLTSVSQSRASRCSGASQPPVPHTRCAAGSSVCEVTRSRGSRCPQPCCLPLMEKHCRSAAAMTAGETQASAMALACGRMLATTSGRVKIKERPAASALSLPGGMSQPV